MGFYGGGGGGSGTVGPGTTNVLAKFTSADVVDDSRITDTGAGDIAVNASIVLNSTAAFLKIGAGLAENAFGYTNGVGPRFADDSTGNQMTFNVQSLVNNRTFTWPNRSATVATTTGSLSDTRLAKIDGAGNFVQSALLQETASALEPLAAGTADLGISSSGFRQLFIDATITPPATTGAQEINKSAGSVNLAAAASSLVVTCDKCSENSIVIAIVATDDTTAQVKSVVAANGSFTIRLAAAATAETRVNFWILN